MTFLVLIYAIFAGLVAWLVYDLIIKLGKKGRPTLPTIPPMPEVKPPREETRFIEIDIMDNAWTCEECGVMCEGYRYCPNCGRKIVEFVRKGETE